LTIQLEKTFRADDGVTRLAPKKVMPANKSRGSGFMQPRQWVPAPVAPIRFCNQLKNALRALQYWMHRNLASGWMPR
jgi:hypothetical protein